MKSHKCSKTGAPGTRQSFKKRTSKNPKKKKKEDQEGKTGSRCNIEENLADIE